MCLGSSKFVLYAEGMYDENGKNVIFPIMKDQYLCKYREKQLSHRETFTGYFHLAQELVAFGRTSFLG